MGVGVVNGGVLLVCEETGNFLLGKRADFLPFGGCWSLFGGCLLYTSDAADE